MIAVEEAARQGVPIQFHTGLGDPDLDLTLVDPAALRLLFSERFRAAPIVLLHTGYPYVRSLAYLAAMFPNVYADMGETILFAAGEATEIYRELIGLAPASKLLFSTDASLVPELYWVGARVGRRALGRVLDEHIADGTLDEATALDWAERMLWRNSEAVYGSERPAASRRFGLGGARTGDRAGPRAGRAGPRAGRDDDEEDHRQDDLAQPVEQASRPRRGAAPPSARRSGSRRGWSRSPSPCRRSRAS